MDGESFFDVLVPWHGVWGRSEKWGGEKFFWILLDFIMMISFRVVHLQY